MGYLRYWGDMLRTAAVGSRAYYLWMGWLLLCIAGGLTGYVQQLKVGLGVTNLSDQVSWGAYIANFTFLVGVAAAAVLIVVPTYVFKRADLKRVVLIAELMAASAMVMCLAFVTVDIGRPDRAIHMLPGLGRLNFPRSILAWDVVVLTGYLLINLHVPGYSLYKRYCSEKPTTILYKPFVYLSIFWAVSIHTVTAFLYSGLGGRPFWNTAILAPRFLVSAFASGPCLLLIAFIAIDHFKLMKIEDSVIKLLRTIVTYMVPLNFFLLGCEVFKEFYTDSVHTVSAEYLFFGLNGHATLVPYIWGGLLLSLVAWIMLMTPAVQGSRKLIAVAGGMCVVGVWVEKGMGLIIPGFIPTPAGDLVEYVPSTTEFFVSLGIWALGAFLFSAMAKVAVAIQEGDLHAPGVQPMPFSEPPPAAPAE